MATYLEASVLVNVPSLCQRKTCGILISHNLPFLDYLISLPAQFSEKKNKTNLQQHLFDRANYV